MNKNHSHICRTSIDFFVYFIQINLKSFNLSKLPNKKDDHL